MTQLEQLKAILHSLPTYRENTSGTLSNEVYYKEADVLRAMETVCQARTDEVVKIAGGMKTGLTETEYAEGHPQEEAYDQALTDLIATLKDTKQTNSEVSIHSEEEAN